MKRFCAILIGFLTQVLSSNAQVTFQKAFGSTGVDEASSVVQTSDGGFILTGNRTIATPNRNIILVKTDSLGDTLWTKSYGGSLPDYGNAVHQTTDWGYIVCGSTSSFATGGQHSNIYLIKTNAFGDTLWTRTIGSIEQDIGYSVIQTNDEGFVVTGYSRVGSLGQEYVLIKLDVNGILIWSKRYGITGISTEIGNVVIQTNDGGYMICGSHASPVFGRDAILIKTDSVGDLIWSNIYYTGYLTEATSCQQTADGGYIFTGQTGFGLGNYSDVLLVKTNFVGDTLWTRTYGKLSGNDVGTSVHQTTDGGYIIGGRTNSYSGGNYDVCTIKTDSTGNIIWSKVYGGTGDDMGASIQPTNDGGYILAGYTRSFGFGNRDLYLIKLDSNGASNCNDNDLLISITGLPIFDSVPMLNDSSLMLMESNPPTLVIDGIGSNSLCTTVGMDEMWPERTLEVYPNPNNGDFNLLFTTQAPNYSVKIFNTLGQTVFSEEVGTKACRINRMGLFEAGIYWVKAFDGEKSYFIKVLIY